MDARGFPGPTREHRLILELVRFHGAAEAGRKAGVSRQYVSALVAKWAPELAGRMASAAAPDWKKTIMKKRKVSKALVVSFRISAEEGRQLDRAVADALGASLSKKARAVVVGFMRLLTGGEADGRIAVE